MNITWDSYKLNSLLQELKKDKGVACKCKLLSGAILPGLLKNIFHKVFLPLSLQ